MSDLSEMFGVLEGCCLHDPLWLPEDVASEIRWVGDRENGSDSSSIVIVRLKPKSDQRGTASWRGDYGLLVQSEDYTGHGCQCSSATFREPSLSALLAHLDEYELMTLIGGQS